MDTGIWAPDAYFPATMPGDAQASDPLQSDELIYGNCHNELVYGGSDGDGSTEHGSFFGGQNHGLPLSQEDSACGPSMPLDLSPAPCHAPGPDRCRLY